VPKPKNHKRAADNFITSVRALNKEDDAMWSSAIMIYFYASLHRVEEFFGKHTPAKHLTTHGQRGTELKNHFYLQIYKPYKKLLDMSKMARYLEDNESPHFMQKFYSPQNPVDVAQHLYDEVIAKISETGFPPKVSKN
jgi:hypothetical protein